MLERELLTLMSFQTCMNFFLLNKNLFKKKKKKKKSQELFWQYSDELMDKKLKHS